uniref:Uncharacterized protein isoform X1 n=1 Tax=Nicotiana tabacum TaxID=4097 RepID=A0A1S4AF83_TOBAC|nr:PREDICTED: uncharacterized protein LOC107797016 isoform X1 [Nicotiana tabacum]
MYDTPTYVWQELYYTHTYIFGGSFIFHLNLVFATSDEFWEYLKNELSTEEAKNAKITDEIEGLSREYVEDYSKLVNGIEGLSCSLELIESQACLAVMDFILLHVCRMSVSSMYSEHISAKFS